MKTIFNEFNENRHNKTDGMSQKAVNAYRRENLIQVLNLKTASNKKTIFIKERI